MRPAPAPSEMARRLHAVAELGCRETDGAPLEELEQLAAALAHEMTGADAGCALRLSPDLSEARMVAAAGSVADPIGARRPTTRGRLVSLVLESGTPVRIDDPAADTARSAPLPAAQANGS